MDINNKPKKHVQQPKVDLPGCKARAAGDLCPVAWCRKARGNWCRDKNGRWCQWRKI